MSHTDFDKRMKAYEACYKITLPRKSYVIIRLDGRAFHTYTKGMEKPFDGDLIHCMNYAALKVCEDICGAKLAYVQSDECSILVHDRESVESQPWFDNKLQKIVSVAASLYTAHFNDVVLKSDGRLWLASKPMNVERLGCFDARAFILPPEEVVNYFIWRQQDATRNSIQSLAHSKYSTGKLHRVDTSKMQDMLMQDHKINWNDLPIHLKRGAALYRREVTGPLPDDVPDHVRQNVGEVTRNVWHLDLGMPILTQAREYIEQWL